ncbi:hypothetical protein M5K25_007013 [Dendrobium thyrsiflorum]|uniref:Uncharacterized protein n=1 Tax=Dendrobium thyrsiflorum TaxID=117978 RepID=A0ABD0VD94_DENTH
MTGVCCKDYATKGLPLGPIFSKFNSLQMMNKKTFFAKIEYQSLELATKNFSENNILEEGRLGHIYQSCFDEVLAAVMKLDGCGLDYRECLKSTVGNNLGIICTVIAEMKCFHQHKYEINAPKFLGFQVIVGDGYDSVGCSEGRGLEVEAIERKLLRSNVYEGVIYEIFINFMKFEINELPVKKSFERVSKEALRVILGLEVMMGAHRVLHIKKSFEIVAKDDSSPSSMILFLSDRKSSQELTSKFYPSNAMQLPLSYDLPTAKMCSLFISVMIELMKMLLRFIKKILRKIISCEHSMRHQNQDSSLHIILSPSNEHICLNFTSPIS